MSDVTVKFTLEQKILPQGCSILKLKHAYCKTSGSIFVAVEENGDSSGHLSIPKQLPKPKHESCKVTFNWYMEGRQHRHVLHKQNLERVPISVA